METVRRKVTVTGFLVIALLLGLGTVAFAGTANSSYSYFTCGGYGYRNQSTVVTDNSGARAGTLLMANPSEYRPTGWYGVYCRLYTESGALAKYAGYFYSSRSAAGLQMFTSNYTVRGNYYSYGISKSYTGTSYDAHATYTSPRQTY